LRRSRAGCGRAQSRMRALRLCWETRARGLVRSPTFNPRVAGAAATRPEDRGCSINMTRRSGIPARGSRTEAVGYRLIFGRLLLRAVLASLAQTIVRPRGCRRCRRQLRQRRLLDPLVGSVTATCVLGLGGGTRVRTENRGDQYGSQVCAAVGGSGSQGSDPALCESARNHGADRFGV